MQQPRSASSEAKRSQDSFQKQCSVMAQVTVPFGSSRWLAVRPLLLDASELFNPFISALELLYLLQLHQTLQQQSLERCV